MIWLTLLQWSLVVLLVSRVNSGKTLATLAATSRLPQLSAGRKTLNMEKRKLSSWQLMVFGFLEGTFFRLRVYKEG